MKISDWRKTIFSITLISTFITFKIVSQTVMESLKTNWNDANRAKLKFEFGEESFSLLREMAENLRRNISSGGMMHERYSSTLHRYITNEEYIFNCSTIPHIEINRKLGHGVTKKGFLGNYKGRDVVVKIASTTAMDIKECTSILPAPAMRSRCEMFPGMQVIREMLLLRELKHRNLAKILGFCVKGHFLETANVTQHGIVSVIEYGRVNSVENLLNMPWTEKLRHALELTSLLKYMEASPLGSIFIHRAIVGHFILVDSHLKMYDLDRTSNAEKECLDDGDCEYDGLTCGPQTGTSTRQCLGYNAVRSLDKMFKILTYLLEPNDYPIQVRQNIEMTRHKLFVKNITASELEERLSDIHAVAFDN